jgi:hypothetical protein
MFKSLITWIFGSKPEVQPEAPYKVETPALAVVPVAVADVPVVTPAPVTTAVLEVKPKFKKADLEKMTKAELLAMAQERGLEVKARAVKADLVKALIKS